MQPKSKKAAGLLAIFLGAYGVHNFYLGYKAKAIIQLIMTIVGTFLSYFLIGLIPVFARIWMPSIKVQIRTAKAQASAK